MKKWMLAGSTALAMIALCSSAQAQVTPEEVWQNWQDLSASYGQTITSDSAAREGDTLVVKGMKIAVDNDGVVVNGSLEEIKFRDLGDGTVEVTMSEDYPLTMTLPNTDATSTEPATDLKIALKQPGMKMIAGGNATDTTYDFTAPSMVVNVQGGPTGVDAATNGLVADIVMTALVGKYLVSKDGEKTVLDSSFSADNMTMDVNVTDATASTTFKMTGSMAAISGATKGTYLGMAAMENMAAAMKAGFASEGSFGYGASNFDAVVSEAGKQTNINSVVESTNISFTIGGDKIAYGGGAKGVGMKISGGDIPFPELAVNYGEVAFDLLMPVSASDVEQDFKFLTKVVDLSVSEELWGMIDPAGNLPHDPATVIIDTKGKAKLNIDLMDEAAMAALGETPPGELLAFDVTALQAKIAGAELTGAGSFTFDNTDLVTFQGMPAPTGKLDLKLVGGNGLLDKLIAMGLVTEEDAMGARMMISMFANPGAAEDELTSTIEFKDKGLYANGQRLQ